VIFFEVRQALITQFQKESSCSECSDQKITKTVHHLVNVYGLKLFSGKIKIFLRYWPTAAAGDCHWNWAGGGAEGEVMRKRS
jgi:hypothetical protein